MGNQSIINKRLHLIANVNQNEEKGEAKLKRREEDEGKSRSGRWEKGESDNLHLKVFFHYFKISICDVKTNRNNWNQWLWITCWVALNSEIARQMSLQYFPDLNLNLNEFISSSHGAECFNYTAGVFSNFSTQQRVSKSFVLSLSCIISLLQNKCFKPPRQSTADFEVVAKKLPHTEIISKWMKKCKQHQIEVRTLIRQSYSRFRFNDRNRHLWQK